jgi:uncharacterized protein
MKVKLNRTFPMPASAEAAWVSLQDIAAVAACMPGAKITERIDATHYKGTVSVKVGPASLSFRGDIEVKSVDPSTRTLHLFANGTDTTGGSGASMDLTARVEALDASSCNLVGDSEVSMSGKAASFGARMMVPVSDQLMNQFAANFAAQVQAMQAPSSSAPAAPAAAMTATNQGKPLNALGLIWAVIADWFRSLFSGKRA